MELQACNAGGGYQDQCQAMQYSQPLPSRQYEVQSVRAPPVLFLFAFHAAIEELAGAACLPRGDLFSQAFNPLWELALAGFLTPINALLPLSFRPRPKAEMQSHPAANQ